MATLTADVRVSIAGDGKLGSPRLVKPSGNQYFDDSCVQAVNATVRVPPPPEGLAARFKRGTLLVFSGKDLTR